MVHKIKLGELLVRAGVLDESRLKAALSEQERWGGRLGSLLVSMGFVSEEILVKALSKQLAVPMAKLDEVDVPQNILAKVDIDFAKMNAVCPEKYHADRRVLVLAMADPINVAAIDEIVRRTNLRVQPTVAGERAIMRAISKAYGVSALDVDTGSFELTGQNAADPPRLVGGSSEAPQPANGGLARSSLGAAPPSMPATTARGEPPSEAMELVASLDAAQKKQLKAIRAMADLLIEKGLISREEFFARLNKRGS